jgi:hypothetical protein
VITSRDTKLWTHSEREHDSASPLARASADGLAAFHGYAVQVADAARNWRAGYESKYNGTLITTIWSFPLRSRNAFKADARLFCSR